MFLRFFICISSGMKFLSQKLSCLSATRHHMLHRNRICIKLLPLIDTECYLREAKKNCVKRKCRIEALFQELSVFEICWSVFETELRQSIHTHSFTAVSEKSRNIFRKIMLNYDEISCGCVCILNYIHHHFAPLFIEAIIRKKKKTTEKSSRLHCMQNNLKCKFKSYSVECVSQDICMQESSENGNNIK